MSESRRSVGGTHRSPVQNQRAVQPPATEAFEVARQVAAIVRRVIRDQAYRVFLYGSWASGEARGRSDIDIGIEGPARVDPALMLQIREACEALPTLFTIEIVDFACVGMSFRKQATARVLELEGV